MSIVMQLNPFDYFSDQLGDALDEGYIWIGQPNKDPRQYPVSIFYDKALTIPAALPLRTNAGYIVRGNAPTFLYINGNYSVLVLDKQGRQIYYIADFLLTGNSGAVSSSDLGNTTDPTLGGALVGRGLRTIKSVAELQTVAGRYDGEQVFLQQYRESNPLIGSGNLVWKASSVAFADLGKTFNATGVAVGRWVRENAQPGVFNAMDYGCVGNAYVRDEANNTYWADDAKTVIPNDDTEAMTRLFTAAQVPSSTMGGQVIDLGKGHMFVTTTPTIFNSYVVVVNGRINQKTKENHALTFTRAGVSPPPMMYNGLIGVSFGHCWKTADAGNLLDFGSQGMGEFSWDARREISEGGRYGVRSRGGCFMITLDAPWINDTYGSGFYMPSAGDTIIPSQLGGSTTMVMIRPYVTNVNTAEPAFDLGNGWDGVTMIVPAADHVTSFGRFRVNGLKFVGTAYSENVRNPLIGAMPTDHMYIDINNSTGFDIDGFYFSYAAGFIPAAGIKAFINADFVNGRVGMLRGALPAGYAPVRTQGGMVEVYGEFFPGTTLASCIRLFGGRITVPTQALARGEYTGTGNLVLFTIPDANAHVYEVTKVYAFGGNMVSDTWIVSSGQAKSVVTRLQTGPDFANQMTLTVNASNQVVLGNGGPNILAGTWVSTEITP